MSSDCILFDRSGSKGLSPLLALLLAFALIPPVLHAQNQDQPNGGNKAHDPTGVWFVRTSLHTQSVLNQEKGALS
jgi:hypothetical protein